VAIELVSSRWPKTAGFGCQQSGYLSGEESLRTWGRWILILQQRPAIIEKAAIGTVSKEISVAPDGYPNDQAEWLAFSVANFSTSPSSDEGNGSKTEGACPVLVTGTMSLSEIVGSTEASVSLILPWKVWKAQA
jgi:hypothetical protein